MKKNIKTFIGIALIGAVFIGAYGVMNKGNIKLIYVRAYEKVTGNNYPFRDTRYVSPEETDIYNTVLTFTNSLVINTNENHKYTYMISKQILEDYINQLSDSKMDTIIKENLKSFLNDDFSNMVEFHNYLDKKLNWRMNQVEEVDQLGIEEYRRFWGLATGEITGYGSITDKNINNI